MLEGIRAKAGEGVRVDHARGVRVVQRVFPSLFDMFGGNEPEDPGGFGEEAEFSKPLTSRAEPMLRPSSRVSGRT